MAISIGELEAVLKLKDEMSGQLEKATKSTGLFGSMFEGTMGAASAVAAGVSVVIAGLEATLISLGNRGSDVNDVAGALDSFTGSAEASNEILEKMKAGTLATVDSFTLMKESSRLLGAGVDLNAEQFGELSKAAFALQNRGLGPTKDMLALVSDAMVTGRTRSIAMKLGVVDVGDAEIAFANKLGKTKDALKESEKTEAKRIAVMSLLEKAVKQAGEAHRDFGEEIEAASAFVTDFVDDIAKAIAKSPVLSDGVDKIAKALSEAFSGDRKSTIESVVSVLESLATVTADVIVGVIAVTSGIINFTKFIAENLKLVGLLAVALVAFGSGLGIISIGALAAAAATSIATIATAAFAATMAVLTGPVLLVIAGIVALIAAYKYFGTSTKDASAATAAQAEELEKNSKATQAAAEETKKLAEQKAKDKKASEDQSAADLKQQEVLKAAKKTLEEQTAAFATLNGYKKNYAENLATVDPLQRQEIENYLKNGAAIGDIAKAYPKLTKAQLDSIVTHDELSKFISKTNLEMQKNSATMADFTKAVELKTKVMAEAIVENSLAMVNATTQANDLMAQSTMTSVQLQIRAINQKADADIAALNRADVEGYQRATKAIKALGDLQIGKLIHDDNLDDMVKFMQSEIDAGFAADELNQKTKATAYDGLSAFFTSIGQIAGSNGIGKLLTSMGFMVAGFKLANEQSTITVNGVKQSTGSFGALSTAFDGTAGKTEKFAAAMSAGIGIAQGGVAIFHAVSDASTRMGASIAGAQAGLQAGAMFGPWGAAAGAAIGFVAGLFTNKLKKAVEAANKEILSIETSLIKTYGPMDQLKSRAELLGVAFVDFGQQGKVGLEMMKEMAKQLEERTLAVRDAASKVTAGFVAMVPALTAGFSDIAKRVTDTGVASRNAAAEVKKLTDQGITSGVEFEKANALATKTAGELTQALTTQQEQSLRSGQSLKDVGLIGVAAFAAAYASTGSYSEALKQVGPSLATLGQSYKDLGLDVEDVALKHLIIASTVEKNNPALMAAIGGQAGAMQGLAQLGLLNVDTFGAMQRTGMEMYGKLQSEVEKTGGTTRDALLPMQGYLQQAAEQARLLGIPLDANTQELIDQSVALGIWKDKGKSANDLLIDGMSTLVNKLNDLIAGLTGIPSPTFTVTRNNVTNDTTYHQDIFLPDIDQGGDREAAHGGLITKNGVQFLAYGGMVRGLGTDTVPAMLTPGEAVLTTGAVRSLGTTSISRLNSGGSLSNDDVIEELRLLRKQQATSDRQLPLLVALSVRDAMQLQR